MSKVIDPDTLDRFQVIFNHVDEEISIRGLGTERHAVDQTGDSDGSTTFTDAGATFQTDGVVAGDILSIISDPAEDGGIMGHYRVVSVPTETTITVDRAIPASTAADLTYKVNAPQTPGSASPQVADGINGQALYSFMKEEWRTLAASLGNAQDLNKYPFPMVFGLPTAQYILGGINGDAESAWAFADVNGTQASDIEGNPRELLRDMGWQERNALGEVLREYPNITTLGALDSDTQAYYQNGQSGQDPVDFRITGPVNQAILALGPTTLPTNITFAATTITRAAGSWVTDGFKLGSYVTIRNAEDAGNDGTFGPITDLSATVITIASGAFTVNADDDTAEFLPNFKFYLKLFARKKGRSYTSSVFSDAGISETDGIVPQVNNFPLSHINDPATNASENGLYDGVISGGDGTPTGDVFQQVEAHTTDSDGVTTDNGDGTFNFASAGSTFNSTARSNVILRPGDSIEITSGGYQGVYEIVSVDDANNLTVLHEPGASYPGDESSLSFTVRTGVKDTGAANATLADVSGVTGTLTSAGSTFNADDGFGDRTVAVDDIVEVFAGTGAVIGYYKVISVDSATVLTLNTSDQVFSGETSQSYRIWRPGMFLQRFLTQATHVGPDGGTGFDFNDVDPDTIDRNDAGNWLTDGYDTEGMMVTVTGAAQAGNNQTFILGASPGATTITLIDEEAVVADTGDNTAEFDGEYGIIRTINQVNYPFHWRLFANGGTLADIYQFLQRELRRATDIDGGNGVERGDITDLLMEFVSPNGTTLDVFPDDLAAADSNNVTYQDMSGDDRTNAFLVGITLDVNANLITSANKRITAYFRTNPGGDFGTNAAIIVDDSAGADVDYTVIAGDIQFTFDYTNNAQGGRTPDTDADVTIVAIGDDLAQHILAEATITKVNSLVIAVQPALERNYSNP